MPVPEILRRMPAVSLYRGADLSVRAFDADQAGDRELAEELADAARDARHAWHEQGCPA